MKTSIDAGGITTFTFDPNGNQQLVQSPNNDRTTTVWDYENKATLVELPSGTRNTMAYEPDGLRVKLEESTGTKKFIWDHQNYLAESDENNDINVLYTNEPKTYGNLISQHRKSGPLWTPSYYHYEALGSTRQLTNNTEAITDNYIYDAWGNVISSSGSTPNPFQFTGNVGYYFDVDTENLYIRARIYSPQIGRWLSVDPLGLIDGMNLFSPYFLPNSNDPSGNRCIITPDDEPGWVDIRQTAYKMSATGKGWPVPRLIELPITTDSAHLIGLPCSRQFQVVQPCTMTCTYCFLGRSWTTTKQYMARGKNEVPHGWWARGWG